jgi:hypothetical protein
VHQQKLPSPIKAQSPPSLCAVSPPTESLTSLSIEPPMPALILGPFPLLIVDAYTAGLFTLFVPSSSPSLVRFSSPLFLPFPCLEGSSHIDRACHRGDCLHCVPLNETSRRRSARRRIIDFGISSHCSSTSPFALIDTRTNERPNNLNLH